MQLVMWEERPGRSCLNRPRAPDRARALSPARPILRALKQAVFLRQAGRQTPFATGAPRRHRPAP